MNKTLPVKYPDITCFPYYADILSIISGTSDDYVPWMLSNFIQLCSHTEDDILKLDFFQPWVTWVPYCCPLIDVQILHKDVLQIMNNSDIISFIIKAINSDFYMHMKVNHKYLSISGVFNESDRGHDLLIYGYNKDLETIDVADNFHGKYEFKKCSFKEFIEAYKYPATSNLGNYEKILLIKANKNVQYSFDLLRVVDSLNDFLESRDTRIRDDQSFTWATDTTLGIKTYEKIIDYLNLLSEGEVRCDYKPFHVLWEHKKCMLQRIEFMIKSNLIKKSQIYTLYRELESKTLMFRNVMLKYSFKPEKHAIHNIIKEIKTFPVTETNLINEMLEQIYINSSRVNQTILGNNTDVRFSWNQILKDGLSC